MLIAVFLSLHKPKSALFDHCKNEQRTLLTTSYNLLLRKNCPPGAYLIDPKSTSDLEQALPRLLGTHGVELTPCTFLTRCVVCNGHINRVHTEEEKRAVFEENGCKFLPKPLVEEKENMDVFRCDGCGQGYWWDDSPSSSASRVFTQATKLFRLCLRGGVGLKDEFTTDKKRKKDVMGAFDFVDVAKERQSEDSIASTTNELAVIEWLREEELSNPFRLTSAYAALGTREALPFTNVTKDFVGCLDYIFFESSQFEQIRKLHVPTSFREMNHSGAYLGHLIPSDIWPSDHIAVGACLKVRQNTNIAYISNKNEVDPARMGLVSLARAALDDIEEETNDVVEPKPPIHDATAAKCGCGCVPQILSLFEMAELRKKRREEKKAAAEGRLSNKR